MGYTHYFRNKKKISKDDWNSFCQDVQIILDNIKERGIDLESNDNNKKLISPTRINFNGIDELAHETFFISREPFDEFCKTNQKKYDLAVTSVLLLLQDKFSEQVIISSDGNVNDWKDALEFMLIVFGKVFNLPLSIQSKSVSSDVAEVYEGLNFHLSKMKSKSKKSKNL